MAAAIKYAAAQIESEVDGKCCPEDFAISKENISEICFILLFVLFSWIRVEVPIELKSSHVNVTMSPNEDMLKSPC